MPRPRLRPALTIRCPGTIAITTIGDGTIGTIDDICEEWIGVRLDAAELWPPGAHLFADE